MDRIGRFEVVKELGRGAMGAVYLARDPLIDRAVAIKTIAMTGLNAAEQEGYRQRFFREAQAAGKLSHAGIVTIYDVGEEESTRQPYIVMEFIAGRTLADVLEDARGPLPLETALPWIRQVAQALSYAHARGIIHRDVKPANIMIEVEGSAKLTDFGIARLRNTQLTTAGDLMGTPAWMSPEQVEGKPTDGRSDIFSLGILLYWCMTGQRPFPGENPGEVMFKIAYKEHVPPTQLRAGLAPGFDYVVARALAKDPLQRYPDAKEVALDLEDLENGIGPRSMAQAPAPTSVPKPPSPAERTVMVSAEESGSRAVRPVENALRRRQTDAKAVVVGAAKLGKKVAVKAAVTAVAGAKQGVRWVGGLPWARWAAAAQDAWRKFRALPGKVQAGVTAGFLILALVFLWEPLFSPKATVLIRCTHDLTAGELTILAGEREVHHAELVGTTEKRLGVFRRTQGIYMGEARVPIGEHTLRVRVASEDEKILASREIHGSFAKGEERTLVIVMEGRTGSLRVSWD